jgi:lipoprotein-releasing system ATP-binding protein
MGLSLKHVSKSFSVENTKVLTDISIDIADGEFVSLIGRSGSGKSTLLYIMSSLDTPTQGSVEYAGKPLGKMSRRELHQLRNEQIGFVFQFHYLLPELNALENVLMPCTKTKSSERKTPLAKSLLAQFGLEDKILRLPRQLSGGEQQRVAIARALIMEPQFLFADEPTGNLDSVNGLTVMKILREINELKKTTIVLVTHDTGFAAYGKRQIHLADGKIVRDGV